MLPSWERLFSEEIASEQEKKKITRISSNNENKTDTLRLWSPETQDIESHAYDFAQQPNAIPST